MTDYALEVEKLHVARGGADVLHDLSFGVPAGRVVGLLGPSGCGKTTLLRCVVGTQLIAGGQVRVLGQPAGSAALRRHVGYASQAASVYDDLSVAENLNYFAAALGLRRATARAHVERVIEQTSLTSFRGRLTGSLSGGQRSRVSLAVALLGSPRLLVLDEPTVGLDPVLREELWQLFRSLAADGLTLLVSSHVMDEADRCDELLLMRDGHLLAQQTPDELKQRTGQQSLDRAFLALIREEAV